MSPYATISEEGNPSLVEWVTRLMDEGLGAAATLPRELWEQVLLNPAFAILERPSKLLRGRLLEAAYALAGGEPPCPPQLAASIELLHAGSLIIDDIEDGSKTRRGGPAVHRVYGLPIALNSGNWLYFVPTALIEQLGLPAETELALRRRIERTLMLCHQGQALDLGCNVTKLRQEEVAPIVRTTTDLKTAALVELAACMGATVAGANAAVLASLGRFGRAAGVALQMLDDCGSLRAVHRSEKAVEDLLLARPTWPWAWLASCLPAVEFQERQRWARCLSSAFEARELANLLGADLGVEPDCAVRIRLDLAFAELEADFGQSDSIAGLRDEISGMCRSYG